MAGVGIIVDSGCQWEGSRGAGEAEGVGVSVGAEGGIVVVRGEAEVRKGRSARRSAVADDGWNRMLDFFLELVMRLGFRGGFHVERKQDRDCERVEWSVVFAELNAGSLKLNTW